MGPAKPTTAGGQASQLLKHPRSTHYDVHIASQNDYHRLVLQAQSHNIMSSQFDVHARLILPLHVYVKSLAATVKSNHFNGLIAVYTG